MTAEKKRTFMRWLLGNLVVSSLFAGMLITMAGISSVSKNERVSPTTLIMASDR
jgi:hypothetical protein